MGNLLQSLFRSNEDLSDEDIEPSLLLEQYASQVLDFSTQYGSDRSFSYTAANCLGVPSKFPNYGDFPQTFVLRQYGKWLDLSPGGVFSTRVRGNSSKKSSKEFIDLRFEHSVFVHGVYVYETLNPGSIIAIWAGDCKGRWKKLWSGSPVRIGHQPRQFGPPIEPPSFPFNQIRLYFESLDLPYHAAIDAVCLLGTVQSPLMENVEYGEILRLVLEQKLHMELITYQSQAKNCDVNYSDNGCFDLIPREAVLYIFQHLDFHSLVRCSQVSRLFRQITGDPLLYVTLKLDNLFHLVNNQTVKFLMSRCFLLR